MSSYFLDMSKDQINEENETRKAKDKLFIMVKFNALHKKLINLLKFTSLNFSFRKDKDKLQ